MQIDVDGVQSDQEIDERRLFRSWDVRQQRRGDDFSAGERRANCNIQFERFSIDISDIDTSFVGKQDRIAFPRGVYADVVFGVGCVRQEGFDNKVVERSSDALYLEMGGSVHGHVSRFSEKMRWK